MADAYDVSADHLAKVAQWLTRQGYLESRRGRAGGVRLGMDPRHVDIGALLRATESDAPLVECLDPATDHCRISGACRLRGHLERAQQAFFGALEG